MDTASKREGELKSLFGAELKRRAPDFLVLQYATNGAPDREVVGLGHTTRWEMKHATPDFRSSGDQELMCTRLAAAAHCRYVIWQQRGGIKKTMIVHPREVFLMGQKRRTSKPGVVWSWDLNAEAWCVGFDMRWLVTKVLKEHGA